MVKTTKGWIFGGAADKSWASGAGKWAASDSAFLFCVKCAGVKPGAAPSQLKLNGKNNQDALLPSPSGPAFGGGYDLDIASTPGGTSTASYSNLGSTYTCPTGQDYCTNYLAGSLKFTVADYEVFVIEAV